MLEQEVRLFAEQGDVDINLPVPLLNGVSITGSSILESIRKLVPIGALLPQHELDLAGLLFEQLLVTIIEPRQHVEGVPDPVFLSQDEVGEDILLIGLHDETTTIEQGRWGVFLYMPRHLMAKASRRPCSHRGSEGANPLDGALEIGATPGEDDGDLIALGVGETRRGDVATKTQHGIIQALSEGRVVGSIHIGGEVMETAPIHPHYNGPIRGFQLTQPPPFQRVEVVLQFTGVRQPQGSVSFDVAVAFVCWIVLLLLLLLFRSG